MRKFVVELAEKIKNADVVNADPIMNGYVLKTFIKLDHQYCLALTKGTSENCCYYVTIKLSELEYLYLQESQKKYYQRLKDKVSEDLGIDLNEKDD